MTVGYRIRNLRKQRKLTLKALGTKTDLSPSFLCDLENERTKPSLTRLESIAAALETSVAYLMGEDSYVEPIPSEILEIARSLSQTQQGTELLRSLSDFNLWRDGDRMELQQYLKAKSLLRNTDRSTETL